MTKTATPSDVKGLASSVATRWLRTAESLLSRGLSPERLTDCAARLVESESQNVFAYQRKRNTFPLLVRFGPRQKAAAANLAVEFATARLKVPSTEFSLTLAWALSNRRAAPSFPVGH